MSILGISNDSNMQAWQAERQQRQQDFTQLSTALQGGDLSTAQAAFADLQKLQSDKVTVGATGSAISADFSSLGDALQSGNLSDAQNAFAKIQSDVQAQRNGQDYPRYQGANARNAASAQFTQGLAQLSSALQGGDVATAQTAYSALQTLQTDGTTAGAAGFTAATVFFSLGQAIQAGNLTDAQSSLSTLQTYVQVQKDGRYGSQSSSAATQVDQGLGQLSSALQGGDLASAQTAFSALQTLQTDSKTAGAVGFTADSAFFALGQAIQTGDLNGAQSALSTFQTYVQVQRDARQSLQSGTGAGSSATQFAQGLGQIGSALQGGDLPTAQTAFAALETLQTNATTAGAVGYTAATDFLNLGQALQAGNVADAQSFLTTFQTDVQLQKDGLRSPQSSSAAAQFDQGVSQLDSALQAGDASSAQTAFAALQTLQTDSSTAGAVGYTASTDFLSLGQAVQAGTLDVAQSALAQFTTDVTVQRDGLENPPSSSSAPQFAQGLGQLASALQGGDFATAQTAFDALQTLQTDASTAGATGYTASTDFLNLGQAIQAGDAGGAQSALSAFQKDVQLQKDGLQSPQASGSAAQFAQGLAQLDSALQGGDLATAQTAFTSLQTLQTDSSTAGAVGFTATMDFNSLGQAIQTGSLNDAQSALTRFQTDVQVQKDGLPASNNGSTTQANADNDLDVSSTDFASLGQALQSGDLATAQSLFTQLQSGAQTHAGWHRHHSGVTYSPSGSTQDTTATDSSISVSA